MEKTISRQKDKILNPEPTTKDILEALFVFSEKVDVKFEEVHSKMDQEFAQVRSELAEVRDEMAQEFLAVRSEISEIRNEMDQGFIDTKNEIRELWAVLDEIRQELKKIQNRTSQDADTQGRDLVALIEKVEKFERRLKRLEALKSR